MVGTGFTTNTGHLATLSCTKQTAIVESCRDLKNVTSVIAQEEHFYIGVKCTGIKKSP